MKAAKGSAKVDATAAVVNEAIAHQKHMMQKIMTRQGHMMYGEARRPQTLLMRCNLLLLLRNKYPRGAQYSVLDASFTRTRVACPRQTGAL